MAGRHLPEAGKSGGNVKPPEMLQIISLEVVFRMGTRAHHAHISFEHIEELRQFIDAVLAQKASQAGNAGVIDNFEGGAVPFIHVHQPVLSGIGISHHGAKFVAAEFAPLASHAPGLIKDGAWRIESYGDGSQQHDWSRQNQGCDADKQIRSEEYTSELQSHSFISYA